MSQIGNRLAQIEAARAAPATAPGTGILCFECPADIRDDDAKAVIARKVTHMPRLVVRIGDAPALA